MSGSLWGEEFAVPTTPVKKVIDKVNNPKASKSQMKKVLKLDSVPLSYKLDAIRANVYSILGRYVEEVVVIRDKQELHRYIDAAIENQEIGIDTETNNSLDPITCKIMGSCLYTEGQKAAYIPHNHVNPYNFQKLDNQITEEEMAEELSRLGNTRVIMHNGKFDYQVYKCTCGIKLSCYWDTMIAQRILDENEKSVKLKELYVSKIDPSDEKYDIEHLFEKIDYAVVDPEVFALYAAVDALKTVRLFKWQEKQFNQPGMERLLKLLFEVEMPVMEVAAEMELAGVCIDTEYAQRLSQKYHRYLEDVQKEIDSQLESYRGVINEWRLTPEANYKESKVNKKGEYKEKKSKSEKLADPPSLSSPLQFSILLYDVLKVPVVDKKSPRGTGEDILQKINNPLCNLVLKKRGIEKLITTYIDKLPACVNKKDGRLHGSFNQLGTDTGRFSSQDPNLQNIPSKNKEIRLMFKASDGCVLCGGDFSQQEPRLLSQASNDEKMIQAYKEGKDLYATIASGIYHNDYWDNMEHHQDGSPNPLGKKRRSNTKSVLLGIMYGRGAASVAEQIGSTTEEAMKIIDDFYGGFPKVKKWVDETVISCKEKGYVEDLWGRRRRLPDIQLPKYTITRFGQQVSVNVNPLLGSKGIVTKQDDKEIQDITQKLNSARGWQAVRKIKDDATKRGINIRDNGAFISQAERQSVNSRIQGSAATMSKIAMRKVYDNEELRKLGFRMLLQVHDELIGECPKENAEKVAEILSEVMKHSAEPVVSVPFKCDVDISPRWYYSDFKDSLQEKFNSEVKKGIPKEQVYLEFKKEHSELTEEELKEFLSDVL